MQTPLLAQRDDEWLDVVNGRDEVIGRASRRDVHARKLWHRAVHVLVFDGRGRTYLQKRSMLKDSAPGCWDSACSGHVDSGEDYDTAAVRELREEIGLAVTEPAGLTRLFKLPASASTGWQFVVVYRLQTEGPFVLNPAEVDEGVWFPVEEVTMRIATEPRLFSEGFRYLWPRASESGADGRSSA